MTNRIHGPCHRKFIATREPDKTRLNLTENLYVKHLENSAKETVQARDRLNKLKMEDTA